MQRDCLFVKKECLSFVCVCFVSKKILFDFSREIRRFVARKKTANIIVTHPLIMKKDFFGKKNYGFDRVILILLHKFQIFIHSPNARYCFEWELFYSCPQ